MMSFMRIFLYIFSIHWHFLSQTPPLSLSLSLSFLSITHFFFNTWWYISSIWSCSSVCVYQPVPTHTHTLRVLIPYLWHFVSVITGHHKSRHHYGVNGFSCLSDGREAIKSPPTMSRYSTNYRLSAACFLNPPWSRLFQTNQFDICHSKMRNQKMYLG